jgi:hypothetical protein
LNEFFIIPFIKNLTYYQKFDNQYYLNFYFKLNDTGNRIEINSFYSIFTFPSILANIMFIINL